MEQMIWGELEKQKAELLKIFKEKFGARFNDEELKFILNSFNRCIVDMVKLMREGKSAHEKFYADIILNSIDAIIGLDIDFRIFLWNKGAENIFGYKREEILGKNLEILIPQNLIKKGEIEFLAKEVKKKGHIKNYETERIKKDGNIINVSISRFLIHNEKKETIGSVGIVRDITNEKNLEKELREKENLALIGEVISSIAHNLSNPLNIISGNADYLLLDKKHGDEGYEELNIILDETTRITKSIRRILNFSKPLSLMLERVDLNEFLENICERAKHLTGNKVIKIEKDFVKNVSIKLDKELITDVLMNIINNSIQAITEKGEIKIRTIRENNSTTIEIADTGIGISDDVLPHIFKPFYSTKTYGKGTGLGLAFADRVIKKHNGKILVYSKKNKGTTFKITIPDL